ncbi:MAG: hypothetical protein H0W09_04325, partial [Solirubrobacterales bacterium]|nr:hypothetical protein [Solirubrobacterales bacterium]
MTDYQVTGYKATGWRAALPVVLLLSAIAAPSAQATSLTVGLRGDGEFDPQQRFHGHQH